MEKSPYFALIISIISVSFAAILIVSVSDDVSSLTIAYYRLFFTVLFLAPIVFFIKKNREDLVKVDLRKLLYMIGIGIILAFHFAFWISSLKLTSVASSVILVTAHPVLVAPVAHFFFKEKLTLVNIFGISISLFGVVVLVLGNYGLGDLSIDSIEGNVLAILGGIAAGLYILGGRRLRSSNVSVFSYAFIVYSTSSIVLLIMCLITNSKLSGISFQDYQLLILMAFISGILGHTLYNWTLKHIRASVASVALLGEPLGSTFLAFVIPRINQTPSNYTLIGGIIIISGIYLTAKRKK